MASLYFIFAFCSIFILNIVNSLSHPSYKHLPKPAGSNVDSSFVELLLVMDSSLLRTRHQDLEKTQQRLRLLATHLNHAMQPLNVFVYLNDRHIVNAGTSLNITSSDTVKSALAKFSQFTVDSKNRFGVFDHAMLISGNRFRNENSDIQVSYLGGICWLDSSVSIITEYLPADDIRELVAAMAYALGRNLGIEDDYHDRIHECICAKRPCIMSSYKRRVPFVEWSSCSKDYLKRARLLGRHYCLNNPPRMLVSERQQKLASTIGLPFYTVKSSRNNYLHSSNENFTSPSPFVQNNVEVFIDDEGSSQEQEQVTFLLSSGNNEDSGSTQTLEMAQSATSRCGNGFVEPGEQCDCGLPEFCSQEEMACCDPSTCKLTVNATCATGECCDVSTCQFKAIGTICRPAANECDLPEYCYGNAELCPGDVFKQSGTPCSDSALCHNGLCRSLDLQCRRIFGETAFAASPGFWFSNMPPLKSNDFGCGNGIPCANDSDIECGRLFCQHEAEKPVLFYAPPHWREDLPRADGGSLAIGTGYELAASPTMAPNLSLFITHRTETRAGNRAVREAAYVVVIPMPGSVDPGFVEDGTHCGSLVSGKGEDARGVCFNHVCVFDKRQHKCDSQETCYGHGVCNSADSCHCDPGFMPPFCNSSGNGGSLQSGPLPATYPDTDRDISSSQTAIIVVSVFLVLILLALAIVAFIFRRKLQIWYYSRIWGTSTTGASRVPNILGKNSVFRANLSKVQRKWGNSLASTPNNKHEKGAMSSEPQRKQLQQPRRSFRGLEISTPVLQHSTRRDLDSLMPLNTVAGQTIAPSDVENPSENPSSPMLTPDGYSEDEKLEDDVQSPDLIQSTYLPNGNNSSSSNSNTITSTCDEESQESQREISVPKRPPPKTPQQNRSVQLKVSCSVPERLAKNKQQRESAASGNV